jgi:ribosomal protein S18 acetylase RimI-like enzyme
MEDMLCIVDVIVDPEYQKMGIGTELMSHILDRIRSSLND